MNTPNTSATTLASDIAAATPTSGQALHGHGQRQGRRTTRTILIGVASAAILATSALAFTGLLQPLLSDGLPAGAPAAAFTARDLRGRRISLQGMAGKRVVLQFWSLECEPCRDEVPVMKAFYASLAAQAKEVALVTVAVDVGADTATVGAFVQANAINYPVIVDEKGEIAGSYKVTSVPHTFFITPDGRIAAATSGELRAGELEAGLAAASEQVTAP